MLSVYLDESMEQEDGFVVIAGFLGKRSSWIACGRKWRAELGDREHLHMRELRGWKDDRNKELLARLGRVPSTSGLTLVYCSLKVSDYKDLMIGTIVELGNAGYITAFRTLVVLLLNWLPKGQRVEVICEAQTAFAARREYSLQTLAAMTQFQDKNGNSKLAKWSSVPKSSLLEPCDYAAYALLQQLRDPTSRKAVMCAPILQCKTIGSPLSRDQVRALMSSMRTAIPHAFEPVNKEEQKVFHKQLGLVTATTPHPQ